MRGGTTLRGVIASALTGLGALIIGFVMIYLAPSSRRRPPERTELDDLRARNADLERRVTEIEARLATSGVRGT
jgi:type II secretory pathway component PulM